MSTSPDSSSVVSEPFKALSWGARQIAEQFASTSFPQDDVIRALLNLESVEKVVGGGYFEGEYGPEGWSVTDPLTFCLHDNPQALTLDFLSEATDFLMRKGRRDFFLTTGAWLRRVKLPEDSTLGAEQSRSLLESISALKEKIAGIGPGFESALYWCVAGSAEKNGKLELPQIAELAENLLSWTNDYAAYRGIALEVIASERIKTLGPREIGQLRKELICFGSIVDRFISVAPDVSDSPEYGRILCYAFLGLLKRDAGDMPPDAVEELCSGCLELGRSSPWGMPGFDPEMLVFAVDRLGVDEGLQLLARAAKFENSGEEGLLLELNGAVLFGEEAGLRSLAKEFGQFQSRKSEILKTGMVNDSLLDRICVRLLCNLNGDTGDAAFVFDYRWENCRNQSLVPVLALPPDCEFQVTYATEDAGYGLIPGAELAQEHIRGLHRRLVLPPAAVRIAIMEGLRGLVQERCGSEFAASALGQEPDAIVSSLTAFREDPLRLARAIRMALPLLPEVSGFLIPPLPNKAESCSEDSLNAGQSHRFLSAVLRFYGDHLPHWLSSHDIALSAEEVGRYVNIGFVEGELRKYQPGSGLESITVSLTATKNILDVYYDCCGELCIGEYGLDLDRAEFQPIRLVSSRLNQPAGTVVALKGSVHGTPALILSGIGFPDAWWGRVADKPEVLTGLVAQLKRVADHNGLQGVYTNVGPAEGKLLWTDDTRIAQQKAFVSLIRKVYPNAPLELPGKEQITFPRSYTKPISRVLRLA